MLRTGKVIGHLFSKFAAQHGVEIGVGSFGEILRGHCSFKMVSLEIFCLEKLKQLGDSVSKKVPSVAEVKI
jgi:hypothetical protein